MTKTEVLKHFGTPKKVANALGITVQAFYQWPETVPHGRACEIEIITDGALKAGGKRAGKAAA